ncbi:MAG: hypothetical protein ACOC28_04570 [Alkalispirochaetaceae bacterium]
MAKRIAKDQTGGRELFTAEDRNPGRPGPGQPLFEQEAAEAQGALEGRGRTGSMMREAG